MKRKKSCGRNIAQRERAKKAVGSTYWRNKADIEITRLFSGSPCAVCGKTEHTCAHHLIPKKRCAMHRFSLENLLPLCQAHHMHGNIMAAHSTSVIAVRAFTSWLIETMPETWAWMQEHQWDGKNKGMKINHKTAYEFLKSLKTLPPTHNQTP